MKIFSSSVILFLTLAVPSICFADAALEDQAVLIQKNYYNGNAIALSCSRNARQRCILEATVGKRKSSVEVNFQSVGLEALMDTIAMHVLSEDDYIFAVQVGVKCRAEDYTSFKPGFEAAPDCYATFEVSDEDVKWQSVNIYAIANMNIYNKVLSSTNSK